MTLSVTYDFHEDPAARLAADAGAGELAAAAAIDAEEGDKFLRSLLADQMASAHLLTMRMAAAADRAVSAAADVAGASDDSPALYDRAAARFAAAAARLNGRYGRGLQILRAAADPADPNDVQWVGFRFLDSDPLPPPEEIARRLNRGKFYWTRYRAEPATAPSPRRRPLDAREQAALAAAGGAARALVAATDVTAFANPSPERHETLFAHQLAATHRLVMRLSGRADAVCGAAAEPLDRPEGLRLAHGAARLMERFCHGVALLNRMRNGSDDPRPIAYYSLLELSDEQRAAERAEDIAAGLDPDTGLPAEAPDAATAGPGGPVLLRRGRLNNGNPGGDYLAAPRCGARTRAACACRQPAMANGRCRFHGGKSTGPRTTAGRRRARNNRLVHGLRSAEVIALSAAAAAAHRRMGTLLAAARARRDTATPAVPAGHGVDRSESSRSGRGAAILAFARPNERSLRTSPPTTRRATRVVTRS